MKKQKCLEEIFVVGILIILCIYVFLTAGSFKGTSSLFPRIVSALTAILCFLQLGASVRSLRSLQNTQEEPVGSGRSFLLASASLVVYAALIFLLGYYTATLLYLCASIYLFGYRKKLVIVLVSAGMIGFIYGLFHLLMYVNMPKGLLF